MNTKKGYIIDVYPLARIPLSRGQSFSYLYYKEIPAGTLVSIPLFRRTIQGIVLKSRTDFERLGNFQLKKVLAVESEDFLTENQLKLAQFLSEYYISPMGIALKHFVPKRVKERKKTDYYSSFINCKTREITLTNKQADAVDKIVGKSKIKNIHSKFLLHGPASSGKTEVYLEAISRIAENNKDAQFLIMIPELTLTTQAIDRYGERFGEKNITVLHSKLGKGQYYSNWEKIRSGKAKIIIGTRIAVFAPYKNLKLIVIDEEQDISFKQWDMNPRYDTRTLASKLSRLFGAKLVFGSATPKVEDYKKSLEGGLSLIELPYLELKKGKPAGRPEVEIIDMRKEKWTSFDGKKKANYSPMSMRLQEEINWTVKNGMQALIFINRQGMASFSVCIKCKEVLRCPKCERALVYERGGGYKCLHCSHKKDLFAKCKKCESLEFKNVGLGTSGVERELNKLFPSKRIESIDIVSSKKTGALERIYKEFSAGKIDILIGTQMITKNWDIPNVGLVGIIEADSLLTIPDFSTNEQAFSHIMQSIGRTGRPGSKTKGKAIIQTFKPNNYVFKYAEELSWKDFFEKEMREREDLFYPPFGKLIKLTFQNMDANKVEKESVRVFEELKLSAGKKISISGPIDPLLTNIRGRKRKSIIIKIKDSETEVSGDIIKKIQKLSPDWIIDVDPIGIV